MSLTAEGRQLRNKHQQKATARGTANVTSSHDWCDCIYSINVGIPTHFLPTTTLSWFPWSQCNKYQRAKRKWLQPRHTACDAAGEALQPVLIIYQLLQWMMLKLFGPNMDDISISLIEIDLVCQSLVCLIWLLVQNDVQQLMKTLYHSYYTCALTDLNCLLSYSAHTILLCKHNHTAFSCPLFD